MDRSFISVFACLLLCFLVTFVIFLGFGRHDLDLAVIKGDELLPVRATQTGTCLEETICRRHPTEPFYEYRRGKSFSQSLNLVSTSNKERNLPVPNIIHFSRFTGKETYFRFHELIAVMAAQRAMTTKIYFWYDFLPFGENWNKLTEKSSNIYLVHKTVDRSITKSSSDLEEKVRFEAVMEFGGTGVTFDIILLKSLKQFFDYDTTMAMVTNSISSDIVVAKPWSSFMRTWYIMDSKPTHAHSSKTFSSIANDHKELLHIEPDLITPRNKDLSYLYKEGGHFDSNKDVLCIKLWFEEHGVEHGLKDIGTWNTVVGEIFRHTYGYTAEG